MDSGKNNIFQCCQDVTHGRGCVYSLQYHIVWCTKYRRQIFTGVIADDVKRYLSDTLADLSMKPLAMEVIPDHIHLLADCKPQQHGARRLPQLWAKADGINVDIVSKTAAFIIDTAVLYDVDVIVFEHLDLAGRKRSSSKRQRLHLWKADAVQRIVADKAHRLGMHINHICAWNTSRLAFDGSGRVLRGREAGTSYSVCRFRNGKTYNADLNVAYNIGVRYFIRKIIKSLPATARLSIEAEVPRCLKKSACMSADLIDLCAVLRSFGIDPLSLGRTDGDTVRCA